MMKYILNNILFNYKLLKFLGGRRPQQSVSHFADTFFYPHIQGGTSELNDFFLKRSTWHDSAASVANAQVPDYNAKFCHIPCPIN